MPNIGEMTMTDEDLARLVMSIDENDIEIIPSNGSEPDDQLDFLPNHFALPQEQIPPSVVDQPPPVPLPVNTTIARLDSHDSEDFEDETFVERLYGLTEMFPNWLQIVFQNSSEYSKSLGQWMRKTLWFCSSSFLVLIFPILVQLEFSQVVESQAAQTRQILLGPTAQLGSNAMSSVFGAGQS